MPSPHGTVPARAARNRRRRRRCPVTHRRWSFAALPMNCPPGRVRHRCARRPNMPRIPARAGDTRHENSKASPSTNPAAASSAAALMWDLIRLAAFAGGDAGEFVADRRFGHQIPCRVGICVYARMASGPELSGVVGKSPADNACRSTSGLFLILYAGFASNIFVKCRTCVLRSRP